jgi:two-component system sensor histidine kinase BaeS
MTWGRHGRPAGARPPWWPEGEPWPPAGPPFRRWNSPRGRFQWRLRLLFGGLFAIFILGSAAAFWFGGGHRPFTAGPAILFILLLFALLSTGRWLRGVASPVQDLIDAAGHVAQGDYSTRVPERGPPEVRTLARTFNEMTIRLQSSDERRRKLLADITHDLRTPLTVIQGNLEGLLDGVYPRDDAHLLPVLEETRLLARLVDDLRTLTLAEAGELELRKEPTDLGLLVDETVASFQPESGAAGVTLTERTGAQPSIVQADPSRIRQVLENLITNALRYTPRGGIVYVECTRSLSGESVEVSVADTGQGIPADELPHVFDRFYKSRDSKGSGLGLTIARNLVAAHGGEITAESEMGRGTTITVRLPMRAS